MGLGHQKKRRAEQKLPPIVWTDLVFHPPLHQRPLEDLPLVKAREAWRSAGPRGQAVDASHGGHKMGKQKERKKRMTLAMAPIPAYGRGGTASSPTSCSTPKTPAEAFFVPQAPRDAVLRKTPKTRTILVDLRPILENVMEPGDPGEGSSETRSNPSPGHSPREDEQLCGREYTGSGGGETSGLESLPPIVDQPRDTGQTAAAAATSHTPRDGTPAHRSAPSQKPTSPVSFPEITRQQQSLAPERSSSVEKAGASNLLPPAQSPDIQLPMRLFLQRLQETTTSENHQLIAQVLRSLRKELQGEAPTSPSEWERWRLLQEPPRSRKADARRRNRKAMGLHPAPLERRLIKLSWKAGSPIAGNAREAASSRIHR